MKSYPLQYFPLTPESLLVQWPMEIDRDILFDLVAFQEVLKKSLPGIHCHGGYNELLIRMPDPIKNVGAFTKELDGLYKIRNLSVSTRYRYHLPVCYDPQFGEDVLEVCETLKMPLEKLIQLHTQGRYTVYAIGFLPGFMYLGGLDERIHFHRKEQPRTAVPKGSVGIGGKQTGIYPQESPGGWQLIGNCPVPIFDVQQHPPFFARVGDEIQFYSVGKEEYELIKIQVDTGLFTIRKEVVQG